MTYEIDIEDETPVDDQVIDALLTAATVTLQAQTVDHAALTLLVTGDSRMRQLNRQFMGVDATTDVLSFPAGEGYPVSDGPPYLGDIAISLPEAKKQAEARGHNPVAELQLLTVHGVLHLLGFDHLEAEDKTRMWAIQDSVLDTLGLGIVSPADD